MAVFSFVRAEVMIERRLLFVIIFQLGIVIGGLIGIDMNLASSKPTHLVACNGPDGKAFICGTWE